MESGRLIDRYRALAAAGGDLGELEAEDLAFRGPCPIDDLTGRAAVAAALWDPLAQSFDALRRTTDILLTGRFADADWIATSGHVSGVFARPFLGIPATGRFAWLRFGRFDRVQAGRIAETLLLLDLPSLMIQAGTWPLAKPQGPDVMAPAPNPLPSGERDGGAAARERGRDPALTPSPSPGSLRDRPSPRRGEGETSLALVEAMIAGLMRYDGASLASMGMRDFWTPDFRWWGPAPIGSFAGHADYERGHQGPFLRAFPDRVGGNHVARIGDGPFVASTGWPSVRATHSGDGWLGLPATGARIGMRVMDFWHRDGDRLAEKWVMIDVPDVLRQLGVDVFARMRESRS